MLLALIHVILVLAGRGCFEAIAIDKVKLRKVRKCVIGTDRGMYGYEISHNMIRTPKNPSFSSRRSTSQSVHYIQHTQMIREDVG